MNDKAAEFLKSPKFWITVLVVVVIAILSFYLGINYNATTPTANQTNSSPTSTNPGLTSGSKGASPGVAPKPNSGLSYGQALNLYSNFRIEFDANCKITPPTLNAVSGRKVMFDNRTGKTVNFALNGVKHSLNAYSFLIIPIVSNVNVRIDCEASYNNGLIIMQ